MADGERTLVPNVNYRSIVQELRNRLAGGCCGANDTRGQIWDEFRLRLACMLEADPATPMEILLDRLAEKWEQDGLL